MKNRLFGLISFMDHEHSSCTHAMKIIIVWDEMEGEEEQPGAAFPASRVSSEHIFQYNH